MSTPVRQAVIPRPTPARHSDVTLAELFIQLHGAREGSPAWRAARDELVARNVSLVHYLVRRFGSSRESADDLRQVGIVGLIKAVDRFDPGRGVEFTTYATPTIVGELKRYLRDRGWALRVPRRLQENALTVARAATDHYAIAGQAATVAELAKVTGLSEDDVLAALESQHSLSAVSLTEHMTESSTTHHIYADDAQAALEAVENRAWLSSLLRCLDQRERDIVILRFYANMTQSQIASTIGISQMHVSRLLGRALAKLRNSV